ncbi:MAG: methyltransferase domain-containing protein [Campylobacterota bacterium]|nr:methyltransferase domain-containing protein [Campylobacterota bacterium]
MPSRISIKKRFSLASKHYDEHAVVQNNISHELSGLVDNGYYENVLEIGTGTGSLTGFLTSKIDFKNFFSLDISHRMIGMARKKFKHVHFFVADGEEIPTISRFDLIATSSTLQWFLNPKESMPDLFNLFDKQPKLFADKDGIFLFSAFVKGTFKELIEAVEKTGFGSYFPLRDSSFYLRIIEKFLNIECYYEKSYDIYYKTAMDFLKSIKMTGANYTLNKNPKRSNFFEFLRFIDDNFREDGKIKITYKSLFVRAKNHQ